MSVNDFLTADACWTAEGVVDIADVTGKRVCSIPIAFLEGCDEKNWIYIYRRVQDCIEHGSDDYVIDNSSTRIVEDSTVLPGQYTLVRTGAIHCLPSEHSVPHCPSDT